MFLQLCVQADDLREDGGGEDSGSDDGDLEDLATIALSDWRPLVSVADYSNSLRLDGEECVPMQGVPDSERSPGRLKCRTP